MLPAALMVEWLAQAALHGNPGMAFHGLDNFKVLKGIVLEARQSVAVSLRTAEIGLLKAIGARHRQIIGLFLTEAACLSLLGALVGLGIGWLGTSALKLAFPVLDFAAPRWAAAAAVGVAVASGLVFGILPARRAAELEPVNALSKR